MTDISTRLAELPEDRRAQFLALLRAEMDSSTHASRPGPRKRTGPAPLSFSQETLWFLDRLAPQRATYNVPLTFRLRGELDVPALERALAVVVSRHESLRTYFSEDEETPVQLVAPEVAVELPYVETDGESEAFAAAEAFGQQAFDLSVAPLWRSSLFRIAPEEHLFSFVVHHIVFDGWSLGIFSRELAEVYRAAKEARDPELPDLPIKYVDYSEWQREWLQGETHDQLTRFWRERLAGAPTLDFPTDRPRPSSLTFEGTNITRSFPRDVTGGVHALARQEGVTPYTVYLAAFFAFLHKYTHQEDLVVGSPSVNRGHSEVEPLIGFFVNMLVLRADASGDPTVREFVGQVRGVVQDALANGELPFEKLVEAVAPPRDPARSPMFQIAYTLQNASGAPMELPGLEIEQVFVDPGTSRFDMSWNAWETPTGLEFSVEFNTNLFDRESVDQMIEHYVSMLRVLAASPDSRLSELDVLGEDEREALVHRGQGARRDVPETTIHEWFQEQAGSEPDTVALVVGGREVTYGELDRRANRLARRLRDLGAEAEKLVAFCLPRTDELVVAILAILKSGAAYLPLDPTHPPARLEAILDDAGAVAVVTTAELAERLPATANVLRLDADAAAIGACSDDALPAAAGPTDLAYALYTSGSTGKPKGVLIEHRNVVNFVRSVQDLFELTPADRVLGFASFTYDVSVFETFAALLTRARLYLATDDERLSIETLQTLIERSGITVVDLPPTVMALLDPEPFAALRIVFVGGEAFPAELVNRWSPGRRFFNGYGPTECTVTMIVEECTGTATATPPIGLPMANHAALVVDRSLRPVPFGVLGELVIGGAGLARGYLNRPELTAEKFVRDPFGVTPDDRLYRTGDLVRRLRDGRIVFVGRIDRQVKIRGIRIELGEVESVLAGHPKIAQAAVEPWADDEGNLSLVAYVSAVSGADLEAGSLRSYGAEHLPTAMVPAYFVVLPELPIGASGKIDRAKLPPPDTSRAADDVVAPRTETERVLATDVFEKLLSVDRVSVHDNFFEVGGNSLQAAQLISRIRSLFDVDISLADFFRAPTVANLALLVDRARIRELSDDQLVELLETLSEEEVERMLGAETAQ